MTRPTPKTGRCSTDACVHVDPTDTGVRLTSTLGDDKGSVVYTAAEWSAFVQEVKDGLHDHTVSELAGTTTA